MLRHRCAAQLLILPHLFTVSMPPPPAPYLLHTFAAPLPSPLLLLNHLGPALPCCATDAATAATKSNRLSEKVTQVNSMSVSSACVD